jgi:hypothetical protein
MTSLSRLRYFSLILIGATMVAATGERATDYELPYSSPATPRQ